MASERDREIWDDATNAVCQAMQEQKMCNCLDGDCLAAKIDFSPEKIATATRPAPAATDTGLETFSVEMLRDYAFMKADPEGDYVTRSQAEELLAAERAKTERWHKKAMDAGVITHSDGTTSHPMRKERDDLEADNAAQAARIKELEKDFYDADKSDMSARDLLNDREAEIEALEAKLAAAEEVAQLVIQAEEDKSGDPNFYILMMQTAYDKARAVLGGKTS